MGRRLNFWYVASVAFGAGMWVLFFWTVLELVR